MGHLKVLLEIAARNLFASKVNVIVGFIMLLGTFLVLVGNAVIDSIDRAMTQSIQHSVAGHVQVYSSRSKEELALFGSFQGESNLSPVLDFAQMREQLLTLPNVEKVVPMGVRGALIHSGNAIDLTLEQLRHAYRKKLEAGSAPPMDAAPDDELLSLRNHARQMVEVLKSDQERRRAVIQQSAIPAEEAEAVEKASSPGFWETFDQDPYDHLEFLENRIAPLIADGDLLYLRYVGTDLDNFQNTFDRMQIAEGQKVPKGKRGFLINQRVMENQFKLKTAHRMDQIEEAIRVNHKSIAQDQTLQRYVKMNRTQTREILLQLDQLKTRTLVERLQKELGEAEADSTKLLSSFFDTDDQNFPRRYRFFYDQVTPLLQLYRIKVGDTLSIQAFTQSGYVQSVNVPIYGVVKFKGMETSDLSGSLNLMDLMSFRDLYGYLSPDKRAEIAKLKELSKVKEVARENADEALFAGGDTLVAQATAGVIDDDAQLDKGASDKLRREDLLQRVYSQDEMDHGVVLHAAVFLKDPSKTQEAIAQINQLSQQKGLSLKAVSWREASGIVGQLIVVAKAALYLALFIFFTIALVVINNAMMMATLQRVREIGTMRAIGAGRGFILGMVLLETLALGGAFSAAGAGLGFGAVKLLGTVGIPAGSQELHFFFSGPRLFPAATLANIVGAFGVVLVVSAVSALYPALIATRVSPVKAMQAEE